MTCFLTRSLIQLPETPCGEKTRFSNFLTVHLGGTFLACSLHYKINLPIANMIYHPNRTFYSGHNNWTQIKYLIFFLSPGDSNTGLLLNICNECKCLIIWSPVLLFGWARPSVCVLSLKSIHRIGKIILNKQDEELIFAFFQCAQLTASCP